MARLPRVQRAVLEVLGERGRTHAYDIKRVLRGEVQHASVYAALSAAQAKGYVRGEWEVPGEAGVPPGGMPRKYFELTASGEAVLAEARAEERARAAKRPATGQA